MFGFQSEDLEKWRSEALFLEGTNQIGIILVHGWSANTKQTIPYAETLNQLGYSVDAIRLKGHGRHPGDLMGVKTETWVAEINAAVRNMREKGAKMVFAGGISVGGNLCLIASVREKIDGLFLLGSPVHLKNHFYVKTSILLLRPFRKYFLKKIPKEAIQGTLARESSYQFCPIESAGEALRAIRISVLGLLKVTAPTLIIQTNEDYLVAKYSPWVIFNSIRSKIKKMQWVRTTGRSHVLLGSEIEDTCRSIDGFIQEVIHSSR